MPEDSSKKTNPFLEILAGLPWLLLALFFLLGLPGGALYIGFRDKQPTFILLGVIIIIVYILGAWTNKREENRKKTD